MASENELRDSRELNARLMAEVQPQRELIKQLADALAVLLDESKGMTPGTLAAAAALRAAGRLR